MGGFYPGPFFSGEGSMRGKLYATTPGKNYLRELGSSLRKIKITSSKEFKKEGLHSSLENRHITCDPFNTLNTSVRYM